VTPKGGMREGSTLDDGDEDEEGVEGEEPGAVTAGAPEAIVINVVIVSVAIPQS
jgi:hypothetical protein